jgi:hypothetical protein
MQYENRRFIKCHGNSFIRIARPYRSMKSLMQALFRRPLRLRSLYCWDLQRHCWWVTVPIRVSSRPQVAGGFQFESGGSTAGGFRGGHVPRQLVSSRGRHVPRQLMGFTHGHVPRP